MTKTKEMIWWFEKPIFLGAFLGGFFSSLLGLNWIYTLLLCPVGFFLLDVLYYKFRGRNG